MATTPPTGDFNEVVNQLQILAVSGVAGAFFRAIVAPEKEWRRRIVQGLAGAVSAIFLGGILGHFVNQMVDSGPYAYLAAGFIMGSGGEVAVKAIQDRVLGGKK